MTVPLTGKIVIAVTVLAVVAGMTAVILLVVNDENEFGSTPGPSTEVTEPTEVTNVPGTTDIIDVGSDLPYRVGVGIADMTGPCVEVNFMGYADLSQTGRGIHLRQFSRAFVFEKGGSRLVLVTADVQAVGIHVRRQVVQNLQALYGDTYTLRNVILTGTHTHSTPGGHLVDFILDISILGFSSETFNAYVDGITRSIIRAHENMVPARLYFGQTRVWNAHMNRSPYSYEFNPPEERARYDANTDNTLTQVRIEKADGTLHGLLTWFSVHTTSMNMTNQLISSDNLGYSALLMEKALNPGKSTGKPDVIAGFFSTALGDVSPNIRGARCEFSGDECDNQFLLCEAGERCYSLGPGEDMFDSTRIIATAVYEGALEVLNSPGEELTGELAVVHQFVEMPEQTVNRYDPVEQTFDVDQPVRGCVPAMGYSFASGTIDGANTLNITQGTIQGNPLLDLISGTVLGAPTQEDIECHAPKPILLATGRTNFPIPWHPRIVSVSLIWLADLVIAGVPGEPTTMSGRRIRDVIGSVMESRGFEPRVVVSALSNEYIHYVATFEEYQVQRYEAASTLYGPHTLDIFLNKFSEFTAVAIEGGNVEPGPEPQDYRNQTISLILPVVLDSAPLGRSFGDVLEQPASVARRGDTVATTFVAANPRNDLKQESTHAAIERLELGQWVEVATDADWETKVTQIMIPNNFCYSDRYQINGLFYWERSSTLPGTSRATFEWTVPNDTILAPYRIVYSGTSKSVLGNKHEFTGYSDSFNVVS